MATVPVIDLPLLKVPVSIIIDDSAPCVNLGYYWLQQREAWFNKCAPGKATEQDLSNFQKNKTNGRDIPAAFAKKFGEWCIAEGVKGKFSLIPCPAGLGNLHERIEGYAPQELDAWLRASKEIIWKNWDITPEMITHTHVMDLNSWTMTDPWEQYEWSGPVDEQLFTDYIAKALELLKAVDIDCEGVTSPGGFGGRMEEAYARAAQTACRQVNGTPRPYYFKRIYTDQPMELPVLNANASDGTAVMSIIACTGDWFGGWTGFDFGEVDKFITADGQGGRMPEVIAERMPAVMCGHWPGFYQNGEELGFEVLKTVKRRLDEHWRGDIMWMKVSEITDYWCAKDLARIEPLAQGALADDEQGGARITNAFTVPNFTLRLPGVKAAEVRVDGRALVPARREALAAGHCVLDGNDTVASWDLAAGGGTLSWR